MNNDAHQTSALLKQGLALMQSNRFNEAESLLNHICQISPEDVDAWYLLGNLYGMLGKLDKAGDCCRRVIALRPDHSAAHANLGNVLFHEGNPNEAIVHYQTAVRLDPGNAVAYNNLGNALKTTGRIDESVDCYKRAVTINPNYAVGHFNLGIALNEAGRLQEAVDSFRRVVALNPNHPEAYNNLGTALKNQGELDAAKQALERALAIKPNYPEAIYNLANTYLALGQSTLAIEYYRKAIAVKPDYADAYTNLANALKSTDRLDEALANYRRALDIDPTNAVSHYNMGTTLQAAGNLKEATECFRHAITLDPHYADAYNNLGVVLKEQGDIKLAVENYRRAVAENPQHAGAYINLANVFNTQGRMATAEEMVRHALRINPDSADAYNALGTINTRRSNPYEAVKMFQKALELSPDHTEANSNLLMTMHYLPRYSARELFTAAKAWGAKYADREIPPPNPAINADPGRRLRIGYVSADFHAHPVGYFIDEVLSSHDKTHFEVFCYSNDSYHDDVTTRLQSNADHWRAISGQSNQAVATRIRGDEIDILIDLSGHTGKNRLPMFALKPAPLQATWMGYYATTGLTAIDYIIADRYVIPTEEERYYTEQVIRLPNGYLCFATPNYPVPITTPPALSRQSVTFGCFNNPAKFTPEVIACWSRLLLTLPDARLHLKYKSFDDGETVKYFQDAFHQHHIGGDRIIFSGLSPRAEYLACYNDVDICLDPFPFNGCTTTMEALWMGLPVITLSGDRFAGHMSETILENIALHECVAHSQEDYISAATTLAADLPHLAELRSGLRQKLVDSPLCDGATFTRDLEAAYREMWGTWCHRANSSDGITP